MAETYIYYLSKVYGLKNVKCKIILNYYLFTVVVYGSLAVSRSTVYN